MEQRINIAHGNFFKDNKRLARGKNPKFNKRRAFNKAVAPGKNEKTNKRRATFIPPNKQKKVLILFEI